MGCRCLITLDSGLLEFLLLFVAFVVFWVGAYFFIVSGYCPKLSGSCGKAPAEQTRLPRKRAMFQGPAAWSQVLRGSDEEKDSIFRKLGESCMQLLKHINTLYQAGQSEVWVKKKKVPHVCFS